MYKPDISIIAPVKYESENIEWVINNISKNIKYTFEILVIYDSEYDPTVQIVKKIKKNIHNIKLIKNDYGQGVLNAIKKGFDCAKGNVLVMMAADRTDNPRTINAMYKKILLGYDVICPSRYSKGGRVYGKTSIKSFLSKLSGISTPYILGIPTSDLTYSFKMFKKDVLNNIQIQSKGGFEFAEELVIKAFLKNYKICEVPTIWKDRSYGKSKFLLINWLPRYIYWYIYGIVGRISKLFRGKQDRSKTRS
jgi:glycosyltransferase involved in cell wall biosynthesis